MSKTEDAKKQAEAKAKAVAAAKAKHDYVVNAKGWIAGRNRKKGDVVQLTKKQAVYENVRPAKPSEVKAKDAAAK